MPQPIRPGQVPLTEFTIGKWANDRGTNREQLLGIELGPRSTAIDRNVATGEALVSNAAIGADIIRLAAGEGFAPHTHPGDHLLLILGGEGTITVSGTVHPSRAGDIFIIDGGDAHAVGAITDHVILSIGSPHRPIDSPDRMKLVAYDAVLSDMSELHCLICGVRSAAPDRLHDSGCPHCPCIACHSVPS